MTLYIDLAQTYDDSQEEEEEEEEEAAAVPKKMDLHTLRQKLQRANKRKKKLTVYEVLRNETIDVMDASFRCVDVLKSEVLHVNLTC